MVGAIGLILTAILNPEGIAPANAAMAKALWRRLRGADGRPAPNRRRRVGPLAVGGQLMALLETHDLTVTFGGLRANDAVRHRHRARLVRRPDRAQRRRQDDVHRRHHRLRAVDRPGRCSTARTSAGSPPHERASRGLVRTFQSLELFEDLTVEDNLLVPGERAALVHAAARRAAPAPHVRPRSASASTGRCTPSACPHFRDRLPDRPAPRPAQAGRRGPGADGRAQAGAARRAGGRARHRREPGARRATCAACSNEGITVFMIDHDMGLVLSVCDYIYVLDFGRIIAEGTPAQIRQDPEVILGLPRRVGQRGRAGRSRPPSTTDGSERAVSADGALIELDGMCSGYGGVPVVRDLDLHVSTRRGGGPARAERCRQDDDAADDLGHPARSSTARPRCSASRSSTGRRTRWPGAGMGHVPEDRSLFFGLTVAENLKLGLRGGRADPARVATSGRSTCCPRCAADGPPGRAAVGRRAADARRGPGDRRQPEGADGRRDEPRAGADHRRTAAADHAQHRRRDRHRRAARRAAHPHGA